MGGRVVGGDARRRMTGLSTPPHPELGPSPTPNTRPTDTNPIMHGGHVHKPSDGNVAYLWESLFQSTNMTPCNEPPREITANEVAAARPIQRIQGRWNGATRWSALLLLFVLFGCAQPPMSSQRPLKQFTDDLDGRVPQLMEHYDIPGVSMALIHDGEVVWSAAYGMASSEQHREMSVDAVFRAESLSKPVTAWGIMRLVEQGKIDLDAPVERYLGGWRIPDSRYDTRRVTVRRLLSNSAGIALGTVGEEYPPQSNVPPLATYLSREVQLQYPPGSEFRYSNAGFNLLDLLIEEVTARDFAAYMADEVIAPLGMDRASFVWQDTLAPAIPTGYEIDGTPVSTYVYPAKGSGGLFASVEDIARFVRAGMTGPYYSDPDGLSQDGLHRLYSPEVDISGIFGIVADAYGLGHFIERLPTGQKAVWHGGQGHGWMTHFHSVPNAGEGIVILTNSQRSWPFMAEVLSDWADWIGVESVKMGRIANGTTIIWALIGVLSLLILALGYRLAQGLRRGTRAWDPISSRAWKSRLVQAALGLGGIALLIWSVAQPYLMVASVFPTTVGWAGASLLALSLLLVLSASLPYGTERAANDR